MLYHIQLTYQQLRLVNVDQEVPGAIIASPMGSSTLDPEDNMDYFNRPGHGVELNSNPPKSPPVKKLKRDPMEEAPQHQTGMILFISFQSFLWLDAILSYMFVSKIISPKEALCKNNDIYPGSVRPDAKKHEALGVVDHSMPMGSSATTGKLLSYCKSKITCFREKIGIRLCIFKIGVTANPVSRFEMYKDKGFSKMWILATSGSVDLVHMLEAALISEFHKHVGCKNREGSGGDGALNRKPPAPPPYFVYISGGRADQARWVGWAMPCGDKKKEWKLLPAVSLVYF